MARLTEQEAVLLKRLQDKTNAPEAPSGSRNLNITIDLGDEKQIARALSLGLLDAGEISEMQQDGGQDGQPPEGDTPPNRGKGYFGGGGS